MFTLTSEPVPSGVAHTVETFNTELASEVIEAAFRAGCVVDFDEADTRRVTIFYATDEEMDAMMKEAVEYFDGALLKAA